MPALADTLTVHTPKQARAFCGHIQHGLGVHSARSCRCRLPLRMGNVMAVSDVRHRPVPYRQSFQQARSVRDGGQAPGALGTGRSPPPPKPRYSPCSISHAASSALPAVQRRRALIFAQCIHSQDGLMVAGIDTVWPSLWPAAAVPQTGTVLPSPRDRLMVA